MSRLVAVCVCGETSGPAGTAMCSRAALSAGCRGANGRGTKRRSPTREGLRAVGQMASPFSSGRGGGLTFNCPTSPNRSREGMKRLQSQTMTIRSGIWAVPSAVTRAAILALATIGGRMAVSLDRIPVPLGATSFAILGGHGRGSRVCGLAAVRRSRGGGRTGRGISEVMVSASFRVMCQGAVGGIRRTFFAGSCLRPYAVARERREASGERYGMGGQLCRSEGDAEIGRGRGRKSRGPASCTPCSPLAV